MRIYTHSLSYSYHIKKNINTLTITRKKRKILYKKKNTMGKILDIRKKHKKRDNLRKKSIKMNRTD